MMTEEQYLFQENEGNELQGIEDAVELEKQIKKGEDKMLQFNFKGIIYQGVKGGRTINIKHKKGETAFNCFSINEGLINENHLENEVLKWNAINNINSKLKSWLELKDIDTTEDYIDNLESQSLGYREAEVLANMTSVTVRGNTIRIEAYTPDIRLHIETNHKGKIIG